MTNPSSNIASSSDGSSNSRSRSSTGDTSILSAHTNDTIDLTDLDAASGISQTENFANAMSAGLVRVDAKLEAVMTSNHADPFAHYECAFGFEADLSKPVHIPKSKAALCAVIDEEILAVMRIQGGLQAYCREINTGTHDFSSDFLKSETQSTTIAVGQLENIKEHLKGVLRDVNGAGHDNHDVHDDLRAAYGHAVPWIRRYRQIAVHSHVFYKVNYVLCTH